MCAVIGAIINKPSKDDLLLVNRVFLESKIRGMHATGVSYIKNDKIITVKLPVPADKFPFDFSEYVNEDGNLYIVGHCRYSTSDLEYNQPISNDTISVVHNGVITQELPENWKELYGYDCVTKNDTELLLHTIEEDVPPLRRWRESSLSVCVLQVSKTLTFFRNGKRPLYLSCLPNGCIITSTKDIAKRAGVPAFAAEVDMNQQITFDKELAMTIDKIIIDGAVDLQKYEFC